MRRSLMVAMLVGVLSASAMAPAVGEEDSAPLSAIVKVDATMEGFDLDTFLTDVEATSMELLIPSRHIYRLYSEHGVELKDDGDFKLDGAAKKWLKETVGKHPATVWSEIDVRSEVDDDRFHAWLETVPVAAEMHEMDAQPAFASLELEAAHSLATGEGVRIAVLDTGIDTEHPLLAHRVDPGYDLINDDADPSEEWRDSDDAENGAYGHGTFVAGLVAQIAPGATIVPIRILDSEGRGELYRVIDAIDLAIELNVDVINMSFGLGAKGESKALDEAVKRAKKAGVVVIAAAGNADDDDERYPAAVKDVVAVTALDADGTLLAPFSNHGKWVHIAAPGVNIVSAVPGDGYAKWSGTSMATPVVSSLAALLSDYAAEADSKDVRKAILDGARKMKPKKRAEKGIIDFMKSFDKIT